MDSKQLKTIINQIEALKTLDKSADFTAGVAAAQAVITTILQEAADLEKTFDPVGLHGPGHVCPAANDGGPGHFHLLLGLPQRQDPRGRGQIRRTG